MKKIVLVLMVFCLLLVGGCSKKDLTKGEIEGYHFSEVKDVTNYVKIVTDEDKVILIELYPDVAPTTVANFQNLVKENYYDGTIFHRVIADFMIQAGGFDKDGALPQVDTIKGEFASNGFTNTLKHEEGILSMARANDYNSGSNQFFICVNDSASLGYLDGNYAAFGKVIAGYKNVVNISKVKTDNNDKPIKNHTIKTIRFVNVNK